MFLINEHFKFHSHFNHNKIYSGIFCKLLKCIIIKLSILWNLIEVFLSSWVQSCYESDWSLSSLYPTSPNDFVSTNEEAAAWSDETGSSFRAFFTILMLFSKSFWQRLFEAFWLSCDATRQFIKPQTYTQFLENQ